MQLATGYWGTRVINAALRLELLESLAQGSRPAEEVASERTCHAESVLRLLRGCAALGLVREGPVGVFSLTELGQPLLASHPRSLRDAACMVCDPGHYNSWTELEHTVRTGEPAYKKALGVDNVFDYFARQPEESEQFNRAMASFTRAFIGALRQAYDFTPYGLIADVGGGHGQFLGAVLQCAPQSRGILFDLEPVLSGADEELQRLGVQDRVTRVSGSFFQSAPAGADLYLLKHILHDWTDEQCGQILGSLATAMPTGSKLLIAEMLLPEPPEVIPQAALMDLNMMVMTGGRERTGRQYAALIEAAGLHFERIVAVEGPYQLVEAVKR